MARRRQAGCRIAWQNSWFIREGDGKRTPIPAKDAIIRSYRPHPRYHDQADSPVRSALPILREIALLNQHIGAQARSRLAGAGLLIVPSEVSFAAPPLKRRSTP